MDLHPVKKEWARPIIAFVVMSLFLTILYVMFAEYSVKQEKERALAVVGNQTSAITNQFNVIFSRDYTLSNLMVASEGNTAYFDVVAKHLFEETERLSGIALKNIVLAPDGVVEKVYPLEGNEKLIGFNFLDPTKPGNTEALEAYEKGELVVTNPFELVQGGMGMGGRLPVYIDTGSGKTFWGLVTITLDYDEFMKAVDLESLEKSGYLYRLWYTNDAGETVVLTQSQKEPQNPVSQSFALSNLTWHLDLAPTTGWYNYMEGIAAFVIILGFALMMGAIQKEKMNIKAANAKLERLAQTDALTACYSRQYVNTVLVNQINGQWNDPNVKYSLAMMDIDYFKSVNDTYGHEIGDRVIIAVARVLVQNCKAEMGDCVVRYGGDEFIVLFNDISKERFELKLKTIVKEVQNIHFTDVPDLKVTVSMGGDYYISPAQSHYFDLVHRADMKLYEAKEAGRNQYRM